MRTGDVRLRLVRSLAIVALGVVLVAMPAVAKSLTTEEILTYTGPDRQKMLEDGARKEGHLTVYSTIIIQQALRPLINGFMKKYPYVQAEYYRGNSRKIVQKVLAEMRAGALVADVVTSSSGTLPLMKAGALMKFHSPSTDNVPKEYLSEKGLFAPARLSYMGMAYNTKLVPPGTQPTTYEALLDPKWKGKLAWIADDESGAPLFISNIRVTMGEAKAEEYLKKLAGQDIIPVAGSARHLVNQVIEGETPIALSIFLHHAVISAEKGAPVAPQPLSPTPSISGSMGIPKGVRHPHAAMLFADYLLSKDGQEVLKKARYFPINPDVEPRKELIPITPAGSGTKENYFDPEKQFEYRKRSIELYNKYFR